MVASTHWLASASGMAVLEAGGNAFDAAVASGLVLHVVEPHLNGLGGDMPVLCHEGATSRTFTVCGQGVAPSSATAQAYMDTGIEEIPGIGLLAATVPGTFGAWMLMLERYGTMRLREVAHYAIGYARDGYPFLPQAAGAVAGLEQVFREHWPTSAEIYLPGGRLPAARQRFTNPQLADTLERLVAEGEAAGTTREQHIEGARQAFYSGFVAEQIDAFTATEQYDGVASGAHRGFLTGTDLNAWRATEERPLLADFAGVQVAKTDTWGQGPVLLQQLAMLEQFDLTAMAPAELVHTAVEVAKLAFADREAWYGDPEYSDVPIDDLLSAAYAAERARLVGSEASGELRPGSPGGRAPRLPSRVVAAMADGGAWPDGLATPGQGEPTVARGDTCHLDVADRWGNVVAATPSGGWLQSSPTIPGLGFALGTRAQMFWLEQGLPSSLAPGARPRTTLSPGLLVGEDRVLAFGTPGGDQQDQWTVPFLINHLIRGMDLQAAIDAPSWHSTHWPSSFAPRVAQPRGMRAESRLGEDVLADLRRRGHEVEDAGAWSLGRISASGIRPDGMLHAAANPRGMQGYAVGR
ncbi:gamma-glutamyltransferase family protein [Ruania halotolerans]|uniref:gamma-glutamyltransferase family protein n=1 Tax=Ruania halotolerans TaxID=2897773 RepID=UPI001E517714|nr:gamma-glutamyltransferase family protein [Ruania halotolerans]UFU08477.1 gamma-glutamyltransferase family protein [Ruania halotolerans]